MKIKTLLDLQNFLDRDMGWRVQEISNLKTMVRKESSVIQGTILRATIPLLYAHWEGFVKNAAESYLKYVNSQECKYDELVNCFVVIGLKNELNEIATSKKALRNIEIVDFFRGKMGEMAKLNLKNAINTQYNLSSDTFENIAISIGLDPSPYETRYQFINKRLLDSRNTIAHGKSLKIKPEDFNKIADEVIILLNQFKNDIQNYATLSKFQKK